MEELTHSNAVELLMKTIPELSRRKDFTADDLNLPSIVFDEFGDFLLEQINSHSQDTSIIKKSFDFINLMMNSNKPEVQNLAVIGVFESLAGSIKASEAASKYLNENGIILFDKVKKRFKAK